MGIWWDRYMDWVERSPFIMSPLCPARTILVVVVVLWLTLAALGLHD